MSVHNVKVYRRSGGEALVVGAGGKIVMQTGAQLVPNSETQAATVAAISTTSGALSNADRVKINAVITALKGVGVLAMG